MIENLMHIFPVSKEVVQFRFMGELFSMNHPVIHIAREDACIYPRSKFCVNHCLECCRGICETKEHDRWFEEAFGREEGCLPFVAFSDSDIVISPSDIELCK